ncbi:putative GTP binding protein (Bud4) [Penicillium brasilianum]|uniref:Putative GTP binding protein (Bud4) n=1 Tax=Penicillium brasilianum TaxID=104259 RepID=A0A1S9RTL5_PENBI|nr:putative GTP binding protein (Bud4) [Penicillium brasilianum]
MASGLGQRPLSEVSPMAQRRNSPIWNQTTKMPQGESPAFDVSPLNKNASPRLFSKGRESPSPFAKGAENLAPYDPEGINLPAKRPSLEDLKRASRVKNYSMFQSGQEYDPAQVSLPHRPLANDRSAHRESQMNLAKSQLPDECNMEPTPRPVSPSKDQPSPGKSSLSKGSRYGKGFDPQNDIWSEYDSAGHRHAKSVTFDVAPPQVNEYEMRTPDLASVASGSRENSYDSEEEGDISFDHDTSFERDDSFDASLEDIEKTPVVLPEDWRFMTPDSENGDEEESFAESVEDHVTDERPVSREGGTSSHTRVESLDSNGERRPLPPLPSLSRLSLSGPSSPGKLAAAFELGCAGHRSLPAAPAGASFNKADINGSMSLEDRLRLMMLQEKKADEKANDGDAVDEEPTKASNHVGDADMDNETEGNELPKDDLFSPPRISRDSILRDIRKGESYDDDDVFGEDSQLASSPNPYEHYDPDVPIPSLEDDDDDDSSSVIIKEEARDDSLYTITDYYQHLSDNSLSSRDQRATYDDDSNYSLRSAAEAAARNAANKGSGETTPTAEEPMEFSSHELSKEEEAPESGNSHPLDMTSIRQSLGRPVTPEIKEEPISEPSTPDSVIRHPVEGEEEHVEDDYQEDNVSSSDESIPEPVATIRAPGAGLKTRPSLTPADMESMAATRRKISGQYPPPMPTLTKQVSNESEKSDCEDKPTDLPPQLSLPPSLTQRQASLMKLDIPFSIQEESLGSGLSKEFDRVIESQKVAFELALSQLSSCPPPAAQAQPKPAPEPPRQFISENATEAATNECNYVQRGYLMRQNTKVVIASNRNEEDPTLAADCANEDLRGTRSAGSSPRKASQQTWTTVPWNSQARRPSVKLTGGIPKKKPVAGSVPPLPGHQSNVQEPPATIDENEPLVSEAYEEGEERGRLFVKVVGIKYLDLPMPRGERSYFALTLDNGLHCVTTSWLELGKSAPIGQEFELIVQNDLEFQLTLQMKVDETKFYPQDIPGSPRQKTSALSRVFASPRRRKELDMKQQIQSQQQKANNVNAPVYERLRNLVARDGSFGRAYVALSDHEKMAFGRPYTVDVACFNEWAVDEQPSSVKSKKSATSVAAQRRPPYKIGKLELQLLFVPKPKGSKDEDMPKSMNACIREMRDAESLAARSWEGFLSQQGGDCPYWRRRFFKLQGSKLTAYHETTRQPRATINLAKASKLIDDRPSLTQKETSTKGGGRRKSAFAEEEEGYMFVEEGFRIRFGNGEVIDFYADSATEKDGWLRVMSEAVGKGSSTGSGAIKPWADLVLKRESSMKARRKTADRLHPSCIPVAPASPVGKRPSGVGAPPSSAGNGAQAPQSPRPRHKHTYSQPELPSAEARRQKTRSLLF